MWAARLALLVAMQRYHEAELELAGFDDLANPDLYYQYHTHNYPGKTGQQYTLQFSIEVLYVHGTCICMYTVHNCIFILTLDV